MRCSGRKIIFNRKSELGACPPRALLDAPRVQPSDARWPGEASESFDPFGVFREGAENRARGGRAPRFDYAFRI